jgi:molybdate transport system permease protein
MATDLSPLRISLQTSVAATAITFVVGIAAAYAMSRYRGRWRGLLDGILILPLVLPPTVVGFFLLLIFGRRGAVGQALEAVGIEIAFSWPATVIAATVVAFPLMYRTVLGAFEQVNPNLLDAARSLGAGEWRAFHKVLLPLAAPGVMAGTVLAFARALGEFGATLMLAGNIPGRTQTMPVAVFFAAEGGDMGRALTWVLYTAGISLAAVVALHYRARPRRVAAGEALAEPEWRAPEPAAAATGGAELTVEIAKRHAGFALNVKFACSGGTLGLLGPSGSGKSMTLRAIAGLETPEAGRIVLNGRVLFDAGAGIRVPPAKRRVGMVFQDYALFPHLTVRENIGFGLRDERDARVAHWARRVQVEALLERYPGELSGGQRQRVALARVLAMEPEALLLDEPFTALDPHLRRQMEEQLRSVLAQWTGATVFVTHDRNEAFRLCERLVVLTGGRVEAAGGRAELFANPGTLAAARVTGCRNLARMERAGEDTIRVPGWGCTLKLQAPAGEGAAHVGIRAHHVEFCAAQGENTVECRLARAVESPFEVTLHLRPEGSSEGRLEADLALEKWAALQAEPQPWTVRLPPERLLILR